MLARQLSLTVCEGHRAGRDDLQHLEHLLGARVKLLRVCVHVLQALVARDVVVDVVADARKRSVPAVSAAGGEEEEKLRCQLVRSFDVAAR
jgi:hypothetical protein